MRGADIAPEVRNQLAAQGGELRDDATYRIATDGWVAGNGEDYGLARVRVLDEGELLREATIAYLRENGLANIA